MYILKNAWLSIIRNKSRNFLIGIIVLVIACATTITLAIRNSANALIDSYESKYDITATIGINRESMRGKMQMDGDMTSEDREKQKSDMSEAFKEASSITVEQIKDYGTSRYVKEYYYQVNIGVNSEKLEKASTEMGNTGDTNNFDSGKRKEKFQNISSGDFTLAGYSSLSAMEDFINGKYKITSGEISDDMESKTCVINSELATLNDVEVGDKITFLNPDDEDETLVLTVGGIFEEESDTSDSMGMFTSSANTIITNASVVSDFASKNDISKSITPTFVLTSKDVIDSFEDELTDKGLSEYLAVSTNLDVIEGATSTISNVSTFAVTFLVITLIIGGIVLSVINMINIRERKYEIGVLRTIGMKKRSLTMQFVFELLIVSFAALLIGAGVGSCLSVPVSNYLLENEISSAEKQQEDINSNFGGNKEKEKFNQVSIIEEVDSIDAVVDMKVLLELLGIGVLLTLISSLASMMSIQKFSPLTILKERS
ncbi:MAG: ABC transporter permease [Bacilli bacterium]